MFQITNSNELSPGFLWQLILVTALCLFLIFFSGTILKPSKGKVMVEAPQHMLFPWVLAGGHTIENGLMAFSGKPARAPSIDRQVRALTGLLVVSVFCPAFFLLQWRRRKLASQTGVVSSPWRLSFTLYGLCGGFLLSYSISAAPITAIAEFTRHSLREAQAIQSNRDAIINELNMIAMDISQYFILPKEYSGGNHRLDGYKLTEAKERTAEATYVATPSVHSVALRAESIRFPSCWITVNVDSTGRLAQWTYGGRFQ